MRKYFSQIAAGLLLLFNPADLFAQSYNAQQDSALINILKYHVYYLADDSLEGRATASEGEKKAYRYIGNQFKSIGLQPIGSDNTYLQPFDYIEGRIAGKENRLTINGTSFIIDKDFYPIAYSASKKMKGDCVDVGYGIVAPSLNHEDYKGKKKLNGKIFLINISTPEGINPHSRFGEHLELRPRAERAIDKGASALIFYTSEDSVANPEQLLDQNLFPLSIPVVFLKKHAWDSVKENKKLSADISTELIPIEKTGHNVAGKIDNGAKTTVVIGAHYDHLGFGEHGSLHRGEKAIHNGADDNASGIALMIELARRLKTSELKGNNYLFAAFSGEEMGLYGSKHLVKNLGDEIKNVNYMLNFDMVGRLRVMERNLQANGFGTSPAWRVIQNIPSDSLRIKTSDSGIGPSDHTSFYLKDVPVLHFFTGAHEDYHKPGDDAEFVNYSGIASILKLCYALIDSLDDSGKIPFTAVADDTTQATPKFKVTLGVIPDYIFTGEGMRIDGITEGRPASQAGLLKGDIVVQLGEHKVSDMMTYMQALSRFKKGDTAKVAIMRGSERMEFSVTF